MDWNLDELSTRSLTHYTLQNQPLFAIKTDIKEKTTLKVFEENQSLFLSNVSSSSNPRARQVDPTNCSWTKNMGICVENTFAILTDQWAVGLGCMA